MLAQGVRTPPVLEDDVLHALGDVVDPELDQPLVELGFIQRVEIENAPSGARVRVELRLPTYWCAPNFSWLMAADVRGALVAHPAVAEVEVVLVDHHAGDEISDGVTAGRSFGEVFGSEEGGELADLRTLFRRKAFLVRQEQLVQSLEQAAPRAGRQAPTLAALTIADLPDTAPVRAYLAVRAQLGLDLSPRAPVMTDAGGRPVRDLQAHLRLARLMRVTLEGNGAMCRGLLATRYGEEAT
jgi:metal-sulfur cluster biosynthetic enzyme